MSLSLDETIRDTGTKFRIYPQLRFKGNVQPELVIISLPPDQIHEGPGDDRIYVTDPVKKPPYTGKKRPPYDGTTHPPVGPGPGGHFDHFEPDTREFYCATTYATVRRVLDIWEDYFGETIPWHFEQERLELLPQIQADYAQSGDGFIELGFAKKNGGGQEYDFPLCISFDVLAHELGHQIIHSKVGKSINKHFSGMNESAGDLVAIIALLHFDSIVDELLSGTRGNLFTVNELDRIGELSENKQMRMAFNREIMGPKPDSHQRSMPLTGGVFDVLVEVFQKNLVAEELISADLARRSYNVSFFKQDASIQEEFNTCFDGKKKEFTRALLKARDYVGSLLASTWASLLVDKFTYKVFLEKMLEADRSMGGEHQDSIIECFEWRNIKLDKKKSGS